MRLAIEQERFHQTLESLRIRNEFYVNEVQSELARLSLNGQIISAEKMATALGERIYGTAVNEVNTLYYHVEEIGQSIPAMHIELFGVAKEIFPDEKFIKFVPNDI